MQTPFAPTPVEPTPVTRMDPDIRVGHDTVKDLAGQTETPSTLVGLGTSLLADPENRPFYEGRFCFPMLLQLSK